MSGFKQTWIFGLLLLCSNISLWAQRLDQDINALAYLPQDSQRVDALNRIAEAMQRDFPDSAMGFASQAMGLSRKLNYASGQAFARLNQSRAFVGMGSLGDASASLKITKSEFAQMQHQIGQAECALLDAELALKSKNWSQALTASHEAEGFFADSAAYSPALLLRGRVFEALGNLELATDLFGQAKSVASIKGELRSRALASELLGKVMLARGLNDSARIQFEDAFDSWKAVGDRVGQGIALAGAGTASTRAGKPESGNKYLISAIDLAHEDGLPEREGEAWARLAESEVKMGQPDSAQKHFYKALGLLRNAKDPGPALDARIGIVQSALIRNDFQRAIRHGDTAVALADSLQLFREMAIINQLLSKGWQNQGDFRRALAHYKTAVAAKDSLQNMRTRDASLAMEVKMTDEQAYGNRKTEEKMLAEAQVQADSLKLTRTLLYACAAALLIGLVAFVFVFSKSKKRGRELARIAKEKQEELSSSKKELARVSTRLQETNVDYDALVAERTETLQDAVQSLIQENEALESFVYRSSNELMGPVARLKGLVTIAHASGQVSDFVQAIDLIDAVAVYTDRVLRKVMHIQELKHGFREISKINMEELLLEIRNGLKELPGVKYPDIRFEDRLKRPIVTDGKLIAIILENILENACIYRKDLQNDSPKIEILMQKEEDDVMIRIRDEGIGMPKNIQDKIFNLFFRGSARSKGQGLGLYLVQRALHEVQGRISIESKEGKSTLVTIRIPEQPI